MIRLSLNKQKVRSVQFFLVLFILLAVPYLISAQSFKHSKIEEESFSSLSPAEKVDWLNSQGVLFGSKKHENALSFTTQAIHIADSSGYLVGKKEALDIQYALYKTIGDNKNALLCLNQAFLLKEQLREQRYNDQVEVLKKEFETDAKSKEIKLLQSESEKEALRLNKQHIALYSFFFSIIILASISYLAYKRYDTRQRSEELLKDQNEHIKKTHNELIEVNTKLEQSEIELKALNKTKDKFFSIISQDLRTPLNQLNLKLDELIDSAAKNEERELESKAAEINELVNGLLKLIENLLYWSRLQMNTIDVKKEKTSINELINQSISNLKSFAIWRNVSISFLPTTNLKINIDPGMISFVVRNIIDNAIKFSKQNSQVEIEIKEESDMVMISIEDEGPGIEDDFLKKISAQGQLGDLQKSSTLSLLISQVFLAKHKAILSTKKGKNGSIFTISLPVN